MNMTNLHFHRLHVSPNAPQDDVLTMVAMPAESVDYTVKIPPNQPPGLYWFHPHPHGESYTQVPDGMSEAIVIEGIETYVPEIRNMRERILVFRDRVLEENDLGVKLLKLVVEMPPRPCGSPTERPERIVTVNGALRPAIPIALGEREFWRIVNASPDLYADLQIDGEQLEIVALDGLPLAYHDPSHRTRLASHVLIPPAGHLEAIVIGPRAGANAKLRTLCFDTGPEGDPNPAIVVADLVDVKAEPGVRRTPHAFCEQPTFLILSQENSLNSKIAHRVLPRLSRRTSTAFISMEEALVPTDGPMVRVRVGGCHHWRVVNRTREVHPFHVHQVHFLVYAKNGERQSTPEWRDTVDVPTGGSVDLIMDFSDPMIRGMSVFHCHLLSHEDKGMMANVPLEWLSPIALE